MDLDNELRYRQWNFAIVKTFSEKGDRKPVASAAGGWSGQS